LFQLFYFLKILSALERKRTITSVPLAEERQILKEISKIKKSKLEVEAFLAHDKAVQETKVSSNIALSYP
jgi:uncharacterized coiled-coil DUF342 family protein